MKIDQQLLIVLQYMQAHLAYSAKPAKHKLITGYIEVNMKIGQQLFIVLQYTPAHLVYSAKLSKHKI